MPFLRGIQPRPGRFSPWRDSSRPNWSSVPNASRGTVAIQLGLPRPAFSIWRSPSRSRSEASSISLSFSSKGLSLRSSFCLLRSTDEGFFVFCMGTAGPPPNYATPSISARQGSLKKRIHEPELNAEHAAAVPVLLFLRSVQAFQAQAQPLPDLPDHVGARVVGLVVGRRILGLLVVDRDVAVRGRRSPLLVPGVREARHDRHDRDRLQVSVPVERRVAVDEVVAQVPEDPLADRDLHLRGVGFEQVDRRGDVEAPPERSLAARDGPVESELADDRRDLHVAGLLVLPADVGPDVRPRVDPGARRIDRTVDLRLRLLDP